MAILTEKAHRAVLKRHIPPARPMPVLSRQRSPGWISARAVGSFVPALTKKSFEKYGFSAAALITDWEKIAGARFAAYTSPQRLKWPRLPGSPQADGEEASSRPGATLMIKVDPARALEVEYATAQLIDRINAYFGYRAVASIRLIQAPVAPIADRLADNAPRSTAKPLRAALQSAPAMSASAAASTEPGAALAAALARLEAGVAGRSRPS